MEILFLIGPFSSFSFVVMSIVGAIVGTYFFFKEVKKVGINRKLLIIGVVISVLTGILASLVVLGSFNKLLNLSDSQAWGYSLYGGLVTGLLVGYFYLKKNNLAPWQTLDIVAPFLILALGISRIGHEVYGVPISNESLWTLKIEGETFHPSQAYEFVLSYLLFGYLWLRLMSKAYHGQVILNFIVGLLFIKVAVQFSLDTLPVFGSFSSYQLLSLVGIVLTLIFMKYHQRNSLPLKQGNVERYEIAKTWFYIWVLTFVSLISYYLIQG
jgi:phosphatidylglycerol---prolipoprotein diacylglyceryl transferase